MILCDVFPQQVQVHNPIRIAIQHELPRIATLRHMMRNIYGDHPGESCHVFPHAESGSEPYTQLLWPERTHQQHTPA